MDDDIKDFSVTIRVRNNKLLKAIQLGGYVSISSFAKACGLTPTTVGAYLNLKKAAMFNRGPKSGKFKDSVTKMADCLGLSPFELFPFKFLEGALGSNTVEREFDEDQIQYLMNPENSNPEILMITEERNNAIKEILHTLTPREERIIRLRFGIGEDEHTLEEIAQTMNITRSRVAQIADTGIRKIQFTKSRRDKLKEFVKVN